MSELYAGAILCGAVAIGSGLLCLMGQAMKPKRINRLLTAADNCIQGKSARPAGTESDAAVGGCCSFTLADRPCMGLVDQITDLDKSATKITTVPTYQKLQDLSREGL